MENLHFRITSKCPLLQHDDKTANPFNSFTKELKLISSKRKKTEADLWAMARIEWEAGLYFDDKQGGYFMKAECFEGALYEAAKAKKLGKTFKESMRMHMNPVFHFEHEKLSPGELFKLDVYRDFRTVKIQRAKILRCRPIFNHWSCDVEIWYEETRLNAHEIQEVFEYAGRYIGLCDYRPKYGRFEVELIDPNKKNSESKPTKMVKKIKAAVGKKPGAAKTKKAS